MSLHVLSHADTNEIGSIADNSIQELEKNDWSTDLYLTSILNRLKSETQSLLDAVGLVRKHDFTEKLQVQDAIFDQAFIGTKQFVYANTFSLNADVAENAQKIWTIFVAHDLNLYRLSYEQQIFLTRSLIAELDKADNATCIASLDGVSTYISQLRLQNVALESLFQLSKENEAAKNTSVAPSIQRNLVHEILNADLFPYLEVMSRVKAEVFADSYNVILEYVDSINMKVRARRTRSGKQVEDEIIPEETND